MPPPSQFITLKVQIIEQNVTKVIQFEGTTPVYDACRIVREKITETNLGQPKDYGLFLPGEEGAGVWLEPGRDLNYYLLKNQDIIDYRRKIRPLKVRMLDGTVKTLMVDDSQPVSQLMVAICTKIGIMNHDEYSLMKEVEQEDIENKPNYGTLTLKKKKKMKIEDDTNWVDHSKTLREQGVTEHEVLLLKRKYFFSDGNIDSQDPIQLNLLYVQCRDCILDGTHPITQEKACAFAGIQCQIQFGDHNEARHKPGFLDLKEFLPQCYIKSRGVEKNIFSLHKTHNGKSELDAKFTYVKEARSLKTYGVTFFLVKEKQNTRNKLVPRLLGVTKDSVLRLDEKTKEILKTWPLTTVRRWAASPNTCTLDFGDYSDHYYPFQTTEGEQIAQLIAGYIDIILKKQKPIGHEGIEGDIGSELWEDVVGPSKAGIIGRSNAESQKVEEVGIALPGLLGSAVPGSMGVKVGSMPDEQTGVIGGHVTKSHQIQSAQAPMVTSVSFSKAQQALLSTIESGQSIITSSIDDLGSKALLPELGSDAASVKWKQVTMDSNKQIVTSQIAAMNAASADVVALSSSVHDDIDQSGVGTAIHSITTNMPEMTKGVKIIAALLESDEQAKKLLEATKGLCEAYSELLMAAEPGREEAFQKLFEAAGEVGDASLVVLSMIDERPDDETQDKLLSLAKAVANANATLLLDTKAIACQLDDQEVQNKVIILATNAAIATSQLVACSKAIAPSIDNINCKKKLTEAAKEVGNAVESLVQVCKASTGNEALLKGFSTSAEEVTHSLNDLLNFIKKVGDRKGESSIHEEAVEAILLSSERLFASEGKSAEMIRQANILAQATSDLIKGIENEASAMENTEMKNRLLAAAKILGDVTAVMIEAVEECKAEPRDFTKQKKLLSAADNVRVAAYMLAGDELKKKIIKRLENAAKHAAAAATQCMAAAQGAGSYNTSLIAQEELIANCKAVADVIPQLIESLRGTLNYPDSPATQSSLINACNQFLQPGIKMVSSAKSALPTITDQAFSTQLSNSSKQFNEALADLRTAMGKAQEACGDLEMESAIDTIRTLDGELFKIKSSIDNDTLRPLPGETPESAAQSLNNCSKSLGSNIAQLVTSSSQGDEHYTSLATRDTTQSLREFSSAVRGVSATSSDYALKVKLLDAAREVMSKSLELIEESRIVLKSPQGTGSQKKLTLLAKDVSNALNDSVNCLPGQKDVDVVIDNMEKCLYDVDAGKFPVTSRPYNDLKNDISSSAVELNDALANVVAGARQSTAHLVNASKKLSTVFNNFIGIGKEIAGATNDREMQGNIVVSLKDVSLASSRLLALAKFVASDPTNTKNELQAAARAITDSINELIGVCTSSAPGQKECESAIRSLKSLTPLLEQPSEPLNETSFYECLELVIDRSKNLGDGMTAVANHAKALEQDKFGLAVKEVNEAICGIVESAAQAAYLVGISDCSSVPGKPGLVDQSQFARAYQAIESACLSLSNPQNNQQRVLSDATTIAKHTSALCNSCRDASAKTDNPVAKRHFVQCAKDVANATSHLVKEIKTLDLDYSDDNRAMCMKATHPLLEAIQNLCTFANSPEFAPVPAKISNVARESQRPIMVSGNAILNASSAMIASAKSLAMNPQDPPTWQAMTNHSKAVSDSIKILISSIKDKAPGQRECDEAVDVLNINIRDLDQASLRVIDENFPRQSETNLLGYNEQVENACQVLMSCIEKVRTAAKREAENLGHAVSQMSSYFTPLVNASIGCASNMTNSKRQACFLDQAKSVLECALQLMYASKESGGNIKAVQSHPEIDESADTMIQTLHELLGSGEAIATEAGVVSGLIESITSSINRCTEVSTASLDENDNFADYQTRMVTASKEIMRLTQEMVSKSTLDSSQLGLLGANLSHEYENLSLDSAGAMHVASSPEMANMIKTCVHEVGQACIDLVKCGGACQGAPKNTYYQRDLAESARNLGEKITRILAALKESSRGTQACINAASTVSGIIGDLDTTIMFATAGTLNADNEDDVFYNHRDLILRTAKALVENTKTLVGGAKSSQDQLATEAQSAVASIIKLVDVVKNGAASLGSQNQEAQVMLINAVKDVAMALGDLIQWTKSASGKPSHDPAIATLNEAAKIMVTNTTSLLKVVKTVEDEQTRGTQALEATIQALAQEIKAFDVDDEPKVRASAEDLVRSTKSVTLASAKAVSAGTSLMQDDVIAAANMGRKAVSNMLTTCKAAAWSADNVELRSKVIAAGHNTAVQYRELLQIILQNLQKQTTDTKQAMPDISRKIAQSVTNLVVVSEQLKGTDWEDPEDPTVIAENELLGAAKSIEAAAKKLMSLRPRKQITQEVDESLNFEEIIIDACKSIATATSALIKAASQAQMELVESGKVTSRPKATSDDGQWSEGLISAAKLVAAAIHSLCEAANSLVQGNASEEKLIASAKQVAAFTAQLLVACRVKADPNSEATIRLQEAGSKVKKATESLVRAAQQAIDQVEERRIEVSVKPVQSIVQDLQIKEKIERLKNELEMARRDQELLNKAKAGLSNMSGVDGDILRHNPGQDSTTGASYTVSYTTKKPVYEPSSSSRHSSFGAPISLQSPQTSTHRSSFTTTINKAPAVNSPQLGSHTFTVNLSPAQTTSLRKTSHSSLIQDKEADSQNTPVAINPQSEIVEGPTVSEARKRFQAMSASKKS